MAAWAMNAIHVKLFFFGGGQWIPYSFSGRKLGEIWMMLPNKRVERKENENLHEADGDRDRVDHNQTVEFFFIGCRVFAIWVSDSVGMMHSRYQDQGESCMIRASSEGFFVGESPIVSSHH